MNRREVITLFSLILVGLFSLALDGCAFAYITSLQQNVQHLTNGAELVCKGRALEIREEGELIKEIGQRNVVLRKRVSLFQVDRCFKAQLNRGIIEIEFLTWSTPDGVVSQGGAYMMPIHSQLTV